MDFDVSRRILATALNDSRILSQPGQRSISAVFEEVVDGKFGSENTAEPLSAPTVLVETPSSNHCDEHEPPTVSPSEWEKVRSFFKEGGLLKSKTSILEKWENIVI